VLRVGSRWPDQATRVQAADESVWEITSVSVAPGKDMPSSGRVVVWASSMDGEGRWPEPVAIAPLRLEECEVLTVCYVIDDATVMRFTTTGAKVAVNVCGSRSSSAPLKVTAEQ